MTKKILSTFIALLICIVSLAQEAFFKLAENNIKVGVEDYFKVTYIIGNAENIDNFSPPDFTNFEHVAAPSQEQSYHKSIVNGQVTNERKLSVTYILKPLKVGKFTFSPATVSLNNKKFSTSPLSIEVIKGSVQSRPHPSQQRQQNAGNGRGYNSAQLREFGRENLKNNIFLKAEVNKSNPYVGEGVQVSYKLYTRIPTNMQIAKLPKFDNFWVEDQRLEESNKEQTTIINGREYNVLLIKQSTIYPQKAGNFKIEVAEAEGIVRILEEQQLQDPFEDDFFSDFFGGNPFAGMFNSGGITARDLPLRLTTQPIEIHVKDIPTAPNQQKTIGIGDFTIQQKLSATNISTDDIAQLKITLTGEGNLSLLQMPDTLIAENAIITLAESIDSITQRTPALKGYKTFTYNIVPVKEGVISLPSQKFYIFNPKTSSFNTVQVASESIQVTQGESSALELADNDLNLGSLKEIKTNFNLFDLTKFTIIILFLVNLIILLVRKLNIITKLNNKKAANNISKIAISRLQIAKSHLDKKDTNTFYIEINKALLLYIHDNYNLALSEMNLSNINSLFEKIKLEDALRTKFEHLYQYTNQALYMPNAAVDADNIYEETAQWITALEQRKHTYKSNLSTAVALMLLILASSNVYAQSLDSAYQAKDYKKALVIAKDQVASTPENADALYNLGLIYKQMGQDDSAMVYFKQSLLFKKDMTAYKQLHNSNGSIFTFATIIGVLAILSSLTLGILQLIKLKNKSLPYEKIVTITTVLITIVSGILYFIIYHNIR